MRKLRRWKGWTTMDNEMIDQEGLEPVETPADVQKEERSETADNSVAAEELIQLRAEVTELRLKLALLTGGAAPEKLCEGVKLAAGIMEADGTEPDDAAAEVLSEYPHLRLVKRSIPQFSAESRGTSDGFEAIRSIFAKK